MEALLALLVMLVHQFVIYLVYLKGYISKWGVTDEEANMQLPGDKLAKGVSGTRGIIINAPVEEVWKWVIQLGADRKGFFSFEFLERWMGYEFVKDDGNFAEDMPVGRVIPASIDESKSKITYNFKIVEVEKFKYIVLDPWGTFFFKKLDDSRTKLIVRTNAFSGNTIFEKLNNFIMEGAHYIMERRMLKGLKEVIDGTKINRTCDFNWFMFLALSVLAIIALPFITASFIGYGLTIAFGIIWLFELLMLPQKGPYPLVLLLSVIGSMIFA